VSELTRSGKPKPTGAYRMTGGGGRRRVRGSHRVVMVITQSTVPERGQLLNRG